MVSLSPRIVNLFQRVCHSFRIFCFSEIISLPGYMSVPRSIFVVGVFFSPSSFVYLFFLQRPSFTCLVIFFQW